MVLLSLQFDQTITTENTISGWRRTAAPLLAPLFTIAMTSSIDIRDYDFFLLFFHNSTAPHPHSPY